MDAVELTRELVRINTVNPPGNEEACARLLGARLEAAGFGVRYYALDAGRASLVARIGNGEPAPLCLTGHLDTVPLGTAPWRSEPFGAETDNGRLFGRGTTDMKSGLAAFVVAAVELAPRLRRTPGLELVITAGEETRCQGAADLVGRSGALGRAGALLVAEPTGNYPMLGHKGVLWLLAATRGVTAHASMPEQGVNAIYKAARAVGVLEAFPLESEAHPVLGRATLNVGTLRGGANLNSVPDQAEIGIDIRTTPNCRHAELVERLRDALGEDVALRVDADVAGVYTAPEDSWIQRVFELTAPYLGQRPEPRGAPYCTDAGYLGPAYGHPPTVILGPGEVEMAHKTDEFCYLDRLEASVDIYRDIIRDWCAV